MAAAVEGPPALQLSNFDLAPLGYRTGKFFVSGTASSYKLSSAPSADGRWNAVPAETLPYTTRIVTVRSSDPKHFNGTVVVEWWNVSGGADGAADWIGRTARSCATVTPTWECRLKRSAWKVVPACLRRAIS